MRQDGKIIFECVYGSHLYGTNTPQSDSDRKGIVIPSGRDIVLGLAPKTSYTENTRPPGQIKNAATDQDVEYFTLAAFINACEQGQTFATELLFCPEDKILHTTPEWKQIQKDRHLLIHRDIKSYFGYARTQAAKYGIKGSRVSAVRSAVNMLDGMHQQAVLDDYGTQLSLLAATSDRELGASLINLVQLPDQHGVLQMYLEVCQRRYPMTAKVHYVNTALHRVLDAYGDRALQAETNKGVDWKAMSHAVRVGYQAIELLTTGKLTFPRPEAAELLDIKLGKVDFKLVSEKILYLLDRINVESEISKLPASIDKRFWINWVEMAYAKQVIDSYSLVGRNQSR